MRKKQFVPLLLVWMGVVSALSGCGQAQDPGKKADDHLTVYLWQDVLIDNLVPYIRQQIPDNQEIEFIVGNNNLDLYTYLQEHGDLPDIITTRRFSQVDAQKLQPYLLDFGAYDVVSQYYPYALQYYKSGSGEIQWLPICGIPETTIVNKTMLDAYGLEVPENYGEYAALCQKLQERGMKPYALELADDWAAHELLQGAAVGCFTSFEGIEWRTRAESTQTETTFDDGMWKEVFAEVHNYIRDTGFSEEDLNCTLEEAKQTFMEGKAAMFHGTPEVFEVLKSSMDAELVRLPYFSQTSNESFCYISPSLNLAFNRALEEEPEKLDTAMKILDCMISEEGQERIAAGCGVVSFSANAPSRMENVTGLEEEVENNELYIRYSASQSFPASFEAVRGLITGEMDEAQAYSTFCTILNDRREEEAVLSFEEDYPLALNRRGGRDAASAILTTVRLNQQADAAVAPYDCFTSGIYKGPCTETQLGLFTIRDNDPQLYLETLSGAAIKELIGQYLSNPDHGYPAASRYELPIASGMKLIIRQENGSFTLDKIEIDGKEMEEGRDYTLLFTSGISDTFRSLHPGMALLPIEKTTLSQAWSLAVKERSQPAGPEDYIAVKQ